MPEDVLVKAIYEPESKMFNLDVGPAHMTLSPEQFGRVMEYLETVWSAYSAWKVSGGGK